MFPFSTISYFLPAGRAVPVGIVFTHGPIFLFLAPQERHAATFKMKFRGRLFVTRVHGRVEKAFNECTKNLQNMSKWVQSCNNHFGHLEAK